MSTASLAQILPTAAKATGFDPQYDRAKLVEKINEARGLLFSFKDGREAFAKVGSQIRTVLYQPGAKCTRYVAITLPVGVLTLDKLRLPGGSPVPIFAEHSYATKSQCPMKAVHLPGRHWFTRDLQSCCPNATPFFRATDSKDYGKKIGIEYVACSPCGGVQREDLTLGCEAIAPSHQPSSILSLTLPFDRQGWVVAEDENTNELASYHPKVQPGFVRYALHGICAGMQLDWWGTREPYDVVFDTDAVEFADVSLWKELLRFAKLKDKEAPSAADQRALQNSSEFLKGQIEQALLAQQGDAEHLSFHNAGLKRDFTGPMQYLEGIR